MIGIVNTSVLPELGYYEFVRPLERWVQQKGYAVKTAHYQTPQYIEEMEQCNAIILSGTYIQDNAFLAHSDCFQWLQHTAIPVLGICAGAELIAHMHGCALQSSHEIGMQSVIVEDAEWLFSDMSVFDAYFLHGLSVVDAPALHRLANTAKGPAAFHIPGAQQYGVVFHPEVRNTWIITTFLTQTVGMT